MSNLWLARAGNMLLTFTRGGLESRDMRPPARWHASWNSLSRGGHSSERSMMRILPQMVATMFLVGLALSAPPARADQADKDACVGLDAGDACTRGSGKAGTCTPDESNANVLTCDDDEGGNTGGGGSSSGGGSSGGCSASAAGGAPDHLAMTLLGLSALVWSRRKKSQDSARAGGQQS